MQANNVETTAKENVLHVRLDDQEMKTIKALARSVYGFRNTSEFLRYVIVHIDETRPTLGKAFAPGMN